MPGRVFGKVLVAMAACALLIGAGTAAAHDRVFSSSVVLESSLVYSTSTEVDIRATGHIGSHNGKCLPQRTVRLYFNYGSTRVLADVDRSSGGGAWAVKGAASSAPDSFTVRLARQRIDLALGSGHHHVCSGDTETRTA